MADAEKERLVKEIEAAKASEKLAREKQVKLATDLEDHEQQLRVALQLSGKDSEARNHSRRLSHIFMTGAASAEHKLKWESRNKKKQDLKLSQEQQDHFERERARLEAVVAAKAAADEEKARLIKELEDAKTKEKAARLETIKHADEIERMEQELRTALFFEGAEIDKLNAVRQQSALLLAERNSTEFQQKWAKKEGLGGSVDWQLVEQLAAKAEEHLESTERVTQRMIASTLADGEQRRQVLELEKERAQRDAERVANRAKADKAMDEEQQARIAAMGHTNQSERAANQALADKLAEQERQERIREHETGKDAARAKHARSISIAAMKEAASEGYQKKILAHLHHVEGLSEAEKKEYQQQVEAIKEQAAKEAAEIVAKEQDRLAEKQHHEQVEAERRKNQKLADDLVKSEQQQRVASYAAGNLDRLDHARRASVKVRLLRAITAFQIDFVPYF